MIKAEEARELVKQSTSYKLLMNQAERFLEWLGQNIEMAATGGDEMLDVMLCNLRIKSPELNWMDMLFKEYDFRDKVVSELEKNGYEAVVLEDGKRLVIYW